MKKDSDKLWSILNLIISFMIVPLVVLSSFKQAAAAKPQIAAFGSYTLGLKNTGKVVAVGDNHGSNINVGSWSEIIQIAAGVAHPVPRTQGCCSRGLL